MSDRAPYSRIRLSATGPGPFIKVPWDLVHGDEPLSIKELARWVRDAVEADIEKRRRQRYRAYIHPSVWLPILEAFGYRCAYCGASDVPLERDHRIPVSRGGSDDPSNLVPACKPCNVRKGAQDPELWPLVVEPWYAE